VRVYDFERIFFLGVLKHLLIEIQQVAGILISWMIEDWKGIELLNLFDR